MPSGCAFRAWTGSRASSDPPLFIACITASRASARSGLSVGDVGVVAGAGTGAAGGLVTLAKGEFAGGATGKFGIS